MRKTISIWHEALWYNDALDKRTESTVSIIVVQEIRRIQSVWFWQSSRAAILVAFAVLVFSDTKSRVINLLLTEFARAALGEYRPSVFLVRTSPKRLGPYCKDLGPIFSQYGPRTRSIRYIYPISSPSFFFFSVSAWLNGVPAGFLDRFPIPKHHRVKWHLLYLQYLT